MILKNWGTKLS